MPHKFESTGESSWPKNIDIKRVGRKREVMSRRESDDDGDYDDNG